MSPASFLISYNIVILHFMKNDRSSYMHALRAYFLLIFPKLSACKNMNFLYYPKMKPAYKERLDY